MQFAAPNDWNVLQKLFKLQTIIPVCALKKITSKYSDLNL